MAADYDLVVFSHLRWNFVWQRPQHLLSRLASSGRRVFFVEEPECIPGCTPTWNYHSAMGNLTVCTPRSPLMHTGFHDEQIPILQGLLQPLFEKHHIGKHVLWFYTPMAVPLAGSCEPISIVYDCMDELSAFLHAPPQLLDREKELLAKADLVFTGGPSIYRAKKELHPNVHCFPSSVDESHFGKAAINVKEVDEQQVLPHPRLGFFGVIDERFDAALLDGVARARPEWQFVMVGPVVKIDPASLPHLPNIHYFGQRKYEELPEFLSGWDVCLLPFARNESTRFISPTKTLEYMAARKPIVSTPIADVAEPYGDIVYLGSTAEEFIAACEAALNATEEERDERTAKMSHVLQHTSWEETVRQMEAFIDGVIEAKQTDDAEDRITDALSLTLKKRQTWYSGRNLQPPVVVVGAGPTGLSAAYHLQEESLLLEQRQSVGGWCRSIDVNGFTFDFAGHIMFSNDPYVHQMYQMLLEDNVHWQDREAWIYSKETYTRYPFQGSLYGLPPSVITECILGAIESRYGSIAESSNGCEKQHGNGHRTEKSPKASGGNGNGNGNGRQRNESSKVEDCCADGVLESTARLGAPTPRDGENREAENFEEFIFRVWGKGIAKHFAIPYNRKLWAVPLSEMETSWLGGRVPLPDLAQMVEGAITPSPKPMGPNARFGYPLRGGFQSLMDGFLPHLKGPVRLGVRVTGFSPSQRCLTLSTGEVVPYEQLISTMPLPVLVQLAGDEAPAAVRQAATGLRYVSVRCVHIGVGRENLTEKHWIYYPEDSIFHRIFVQGNASPHCNPAGGFGLTCEITYHPQYKPLPCDGEELIQRCIADCKKVGMFREDDPIWATAQVDLPHAYVVYDHARVRNVAIIRDWLAEQEVTLAGRYSEWEYYNSDHAFLAGKKAAEKVLSTRSSTV